MAARKREPDAPKKSGPERITLDPKIVRGLSSIFCTQQEAADVLGVSVPTLQRRIEDTPEIESAWREGKSQGKTALRRFMWDAAKKGNSTMQIWLSKQELGYRDQPPDTTSRGTLAEALALLTANPAMLRALVAALPPE